jgi:hypothetical protein
MVAEETAHDNGLLLNLDNQTGTRSGLADRSEEVLYIWSVVSKMYQESQELKTYQRSRRTPLPCI